MTLRDRILFHEIHPVKLETNLGSGIFCLYFLWEHAKNFVYVYEASHQQSLCASRRI